MGFSYKKSYEKLLKVAQDHGLKVLIVPKSMLKDYAGMNSRAADSMGFKMPDDTIYLAKALTIRGRYHTLRHEISEFFEMEKGHPYWTSHVTSLKIEDKGSLRCLFN